MNFLSGPGRGVILIKMEFPEDKVIGAHRVDRRSRSDDGGDLAWQRADDQHGEVQSHRPRRQGARADAARRLHARHPQRGAAAGVAGQRLRRRQADDRVSCGGERCSRNCRKPWIFTAPCSPKAAARSSATTPRRRWPTSCCCSEIPTTYDKAQERQVNAGNLLLRGVPGVGKTFFGVILAAISDAKFARMQGRADLQPTEVVGFQMINPATGAAGDRVRADGVGRGDPARRDQPHPAEVAERVSRRACRIAPSPSARRPTSCPLSASRSRR